MIKPINERILVRQDVKDKETAHGILIPDDILNKDKPLTGIVVQGSDAIPTDSHIVFSAYGFDEVEHGGETLLLVAEHNVLALIV